MKKLVSLVIVMALVLSLAVGAAAAYDAKITITNAVVDQTYSYYSIFTLISYSEENNNYAYSLREEWKAFFDDKTNFTEEATFNAFNTAISDDYHIVGTVTLTDAEIQNLVSDMLGYVKKVNSDTDDTNNIPSESVKATSSTVEFSDLPYGWYLIDSTTGMLCVLDTNTSSVSIVDKSTAPTLTKQVKNIEDTYVDTTTATIGDTLYYEIKITAGSGAQNYVLTDIIPDSITAPSSVNVTCTNTALTMPSATIENNSIKLDFTNLDLKKDDVITITYGAQLNANATIGDDGNKNIATLTYGDNTTPVITADAVVNSYSFDLVKTNSENKVITGATFELYADANEEKEISVVADGDNTYRVATTGETPVNIAAGNVTIEGLANGTYYLKEINAPEGYNPLSTLQPVTITDANNSATVTNDTYTSGGVQVINQSGSVLPSTGGTGTTIFYVLGGLMFVGALVLLVTNKRMKAE